jgi:hypothetical protein
VSQRLSYHSVDGFPGAENKAYYDREIAKLKLKAQSSAGFIRGA